MQGVGRFTGGWLAPSTGEQTNGFIDRFTTNRITQLPGLGNCHIVTEMSNMYRDKGIIHK